MSFLFLRWFLCSVCQQCMPSFLLLFLIHLSACLRVCFKHYSITQVCQCVWVISLLIKVRIVLSKINQIVCHRCLFHKYTNGVKCTLLFIVWIISFWFCNNSHIITEYAVHLSFIYITRFHNNFQEPGDTAKEGLPFNREKRDRIRIRLVLLNGGKGKIKREKESIKTINNKLSQMANCERERQTLMTIACWVSRSEWKRNTHSIMVTWSSPAYKHFQNGKSEASFLK